MARSAGRVLGAPHPQGRGRQSLGLQMWHSVRKERAGAPGRWKINRNSTTFAPWIFNWAFPQAHGTHGKLSETFVDREDLTLDQDPTSTIRAKGSETLLSYITV